MRRVMMLVALVALLSMVFGGVALAVNKQCSLRPCEGTNQNDTLFERGGNGVNDTIYGRAGDDTIDAGTFSNDRDVLFGNGGDDRLDARDGDGRDELYGGTGFDRCFGDPGDLFRGCEVINGVVQ